MRRVCASLMAASLFLPGGPVFAQATATFNGRVVDQGDAILPGATVTATNARTGIVRTTVTNNEGLYNLPALDAGVYDVKVDLTGFSSSTRREVVLAVAATLTLDFKLAVGALSETVEVSGTAPLIETTQS